MIFGKADIIDGVLDATNDSYPLTPNSTFSASRPFRAAGILTAVMISAFGIAFSDLLYTAELWAVGGIATVCFLLGNSIAHLLVTNADLRGSDRSVATWGTYPHLSRKRRELADVVRKGGKS